MDFTVIHNKGVEYSVEAPTKDSGVFKLAPRDLNTLGEERELLASVDQLHSTVRSPEENIQSLNRQLSVPPAALESVRSEVRPLEASLEAVNRRLSTLEAGLSQWRPSMTRIASRSLDACALRHKGVKTSRKYWLKSGVIQTIIRLSYVVPKRCFVMTSIELHMIIRGLFLTPCRNLLSHLALPAHVR